jgi:peptide deformylase
MKIVISPDPLLREHCEEVDLEDHSIRRLAKQMAKEMYKNDGCGIAAPQVGIMKRMIVLDCNVDQTRKDYTVLVNPVIKEHSEDTYVGDEGCLSIPGISVPIERYKSVTVGYKDLEGNDCEISGDEDLLCRCLQHEIDHLDGVTMFERLDPLLRIKALKAYDAAIAAGAGPSSDRTVIE